MNNQNGSYGGIPSSAPYYNMNLPSQNNGVVTTQQMQTPVSPLQQFSNYNQPSESLRRYRIFSVPAVWMLLGFNQNGGLRVIPWLS